MRVCMLAANPLLYDGRALRHAATLSRWGHHVTVIGVIGPADSDAPVRFAGAGDQGGAPVEYTRIDRRRRGIWPRTLWAASALRQRAARDALRLLSRWPVATLAPAMAVLAELTVATSAPELAARALRVPCDLLYANDLTTLPAAAWVSRLRGVPFVYDARELYLDEDAGLSGIERRARRQAERSRIHRAGAVVTVNDLVADELVRLYQIPRPHVVRNVAPMIDVPALDGDEGDDRQGAGDADGARGTLRLLYQSANIGLRQEGTDDLLRAMARAMARARITLTLRGGLAAPERARLLRRIESLGLGGAVHVRPPVSGVEQLVRISAEGGEEVGLAVHPPTCLNNVYTTSGKVFEYQMAGLAVCATDLPGNRLSVDEEAGIFYPHGDDRRLAEILVALAWDRGRLRRMRRAARHRARTELNWEREQIALLRACAEARAGG